MCAGVNGVSIGVGTVYRLDDGLCISVDDVRGFHHVLVSFKFDCWRSIGENDMTGGSVDSSTVDEMLLECPLRGVGYMHRVQKKVFPWCLFWSKHSLLKSLIRNSETEFSHLQPW